ncbi:MAG: hypothetical protein DRQ24_03465 [Candidatus Latescibacterota bacterium]|nr:MAG: hypothetical protein DRQ24_03465 [Candidatus Latescibacterota bacterium]
MLCARQMKTYDLAITAVFVALVVTLGYAFIFLPNVEAVTATVFISGFLLGKKRGSIVGLLGEFIYASLNPYGASMPPLLAAQVASMGLTGLLGGSVGSRYKEKITLSAVLLLRFALWGILLTLIYDVATCAGFFAFAGFSARQMLASLAVGLPFYAVHLGSNAIIFASVVPVLLKKALDRKLLREREYR